MPELPEVQTIINELEKKIIGKRIAEIRQLRKNTIHSSITLSKLNGKCISDIRRRGKYIIIYAKDYKFIIHLRMTGKLIFKKHFDKNPSHLRAYIRFSDQSVLLFDDIRTFGNIYILEKNKSHKSLTKLGVEPLSKDFNLEYFKKRINKKKQPVKNFLLDQYIIAGIGNIYASEILFDAKVNPTKSVAKLTDKEICRIVDSTKYILKKALKYNGTTISDYRRVDDKTGEFQNFLKVYQKNTCQCGKKILKIKMAGRSTFYCPLCQKLS